MVAGALIGLEREWRQKNAGVKTQALVALGAAGFAMISGPDNRITANIVTGIGFIGAGVIMHRGVTVQGVTTAATLWANAAMSASIGIGQPIAGVTLFAGILVVQFVMRRVDQAIAKARRTRVPSRVEIVVHCDDEALAAVNEAWKNYALPQEVQAGRRIVTRAPDHLTWRVHFWAPERQAIDLTPLEEKLARQRGVSKVEARQAGFAEE
ncbi:MAG TPA: MgtC/SapB family protein [Thermoanaerobaculia bacterium]